MSQEEKIMACPGCYMCGSVDYTVGRARAQIRIGERAWEASGRRGEQSPWADAVHYLIPRYGEAEEIPDVAYFRDVDLGLLRTEVAKEPICNGG